MTERRSKAEPSQAPAILKEKILGSLAGEEFNLRKREVHVMTRLSSDIVDILDALVELGIFKSRSEVVSALVEKGIAAQPDLYEDVKGLAKRITDMRETAKKMAVEAFQEKTTR